ncbi:MAG: hypothetical protein KJO07_25605 [Deltaproteobacteria bacterium]|nr:hypothetical protein [Deltaproteobacteria bacterium]
MKAVKTSSEYTVYQKRSGRYAVKNAGRKWVNGDDKVKILVAEGLIEAPKVKAPEPAEGEGGEAEGGEAAAE